MCLVKKKDIENMNIIYKNTAKMIESVLKIISKTFYRNENNRT